MTNLFPGKFITTDINPILVLLHAHTHTHTHADPVQPLSVYIPELHFPTLKLISREVGREWKMLARHLGLDETTIQGIHQANFGDLHEASLQSLLK